MKLLTLAKNCNSSLWRPFLHSHPFHTHNKPLNSRIYMYSDCLHTSTNMKDVIFLGFKLNWRSYAHDQLSPQPQKQPQPQPQPQPAYATSQAQYSEPAPRPAARPAPQPAHQSDEEEPEPVQQPISYRPFENAPAQIRQLLQFQLQIPYLNAIPEHLRYFYFYFQIADFSCFDF